VYPVAPRAEFRGDLFFAQHQCFFFFLSPSLNRLDLFDPTFCAPRGASVANALGACHTPRLFFSLCDDSSGHGTLR